MFSKEHIEGQLHTRWAARNLVYKDVTGSTNDDAKKLGEDGAPHGTLVVTDNQVSGRGTKGRSWKTPSGSNIAMSLLVRPVAPTNRIPMLTLIMGLSIAEGIERTLKESGGKDDFYTGIKWPNDIVISGKKICGILTELHMNDDNLVDNVVIGVGINVSMQDFPDEIREIAGSILSETGIKVDRGSVVANCMKCFEDNYDKYNKTFDLSLLKEQYEKRLINKGKQVRIMNPKGEYEALAQGITKDGALVVTLADGSDKVINAGEVSVRGLYSYV